MPTYRHLASAVLLSIALLGVFSLAALPQSAQAARTCGGLTCLIPEECLGAQGQPNGEPVCDISSFVKMGINLTQIILGVLGSVALLMFTYGGLVWLTSTGNSAQVKKGQDILTNAIMGMAIVLGAYLIVSALLSVITGANFGDAIKLFGDKSPFQYEYTIPPASSAP